MSFNPNLPTLIVLTGPTAVGKTAFCIRLAQHLNAPVISGDSRQFYKELKIGTAYPSAEELASVPHYFLGFLSIHDYYSVSRFEQEVLQLLQKLFEKHSLVILTGGSGLYLDAVTKGIDELPEPDEQIRDYVIQLFEYDGLESLQFQVKTLDPEFYRETDIKNYKRLMRALEVCLQTGKPFSAQRLNQPAQRPFNTLKMVLNRERSELFERINQRVDAMVAQGLEAEARSVYPFRHLNALNTVGYKEFFSYFDGQISKEQAIEDIKTHTRRYAKRQLSWFKRDSDYHWVTPDEFEKVLRLVPFKIKY